MNNQPLLDQVAIVTGAAQGLGAAIVARLAQEGAHVVVADLNLAGAQDVANIVAQATGRRTLAIAVDVTVEEQVAAMVDQAIETFGRVDLMVANAGIVMSGAIEDFDLARWRKVVDVNLTGYFLCAKHVARVMKQQQSGVIVQINSKSGKKRQL